MGGCSSSTEKDPFLPISTFNERYELQDAVLGEGAMGKVVLCMRRSDGTDLAAKTVKRDKNALGEVAVMQQLQHANILRLEQTFAGAPTPDGGDTLLLVVELAPGGDLLLEVEKHGGKLNERDTAYYMRQVLRAAAYMAEQPNGGIVHRDLKLTNVFLTQRKRRHDGSMALPDAKIGDFGIAASADELAATATGASGAGTAQYASPEALAGNACTPASDVWSLGVMCFTMLCGLYPYELPMDLTSTEEITIAWEPGKSGEITADAKAMVRSMLLRNPASRPRAADLADCNWVKHQLWLMDQDFAEC